MSGPFVLLKGITWAPYLLEECGKSGQAGQSLEERTRGMGAEDGTFLGAGCASARAWSRGAYLAVWGKWRLWWRVGEVAEDVGMRGVTEEAGRDIVGGGIL